MVVCLMRISARSRRIIGILDAALIGILIFLETSLILLNSDKLLELRSIGIFQWLWEHDYLFLCSKIVVCALLLFSVALLVFVFDVAISQESQYFHLNFKRGYSTSIYMLFVSLILCILCFSLSLKVSAEVDSKMTHLLMNSYTKYGESRESRRLADRIHMEYSCCGVNSIEDFVDLSEVDRKLKPQTKIRECNDWEYCGVPLSCCKSTSCSQKVQLLVDGWDPVNITEKWFYRRGCIGELDNSFIFFNYPNYLINDSTMVLVLGFHLGCLVLTQILITSSVTLHGARLDPNSASSFAWLINVGQPNPKSLMKELNPDIQPSEFETSTSSQKVEELEKESLETILDGTATVTETEASTGASTGGSTTATGTGASFDESTGSSSSASSTNIPGTTTDTAVSTASVVETPGGPNDVLLLDSDNATTTKVSGNKKNVAKGGKGNGPKKGGAKQKTSGKPKQKNNTARGKNKTKTKTNTKKSKAKAKPKAKAKAKPQSKKPAAKGKKK